ncbi:MAG: TIM barrel protein [Clostridia bacterium]|nr:TIM barrel protein [Clostridia bacterium]
MKISTQTSYLGEQFGDINAVKMIAEAGYDAIDYSMFYMDLKGNPLGSDDYRSFVTELKKAADDAGISFNQTHAPFPSYKRGDDEYNEVTFKNIVKSMEICAFLGAPHIVVHPFAVYGRNEKEYETEINLKIFDLLIPYCRKYNIKIAIENLCGKDFSYTTPEELKELIDMFDDRYIGGLIDTGHAEISGVDASDFITRFGSEKLLGLHIQDNNKKNDLHNLPYVCDLDWTKIMTSLKKVGYKGDLTYEADKFLRMFPRELALEGEKFMVAVGKHLRQIFENA